MKRASGSLLLMSLAAGWILTTGCNRNPPQADSPSNTREGTAREGVKTRKVRVRPQPEVEPADPQSLAGIQNAVPPTPPTSPEAVESKLDQPADAPAKLATPTPIPQAAGKTRQPAGEKKVALAKKPSTKEKAGGSGSKKQEADALFDKPTVLNIQIEIPQGGLNALRHSRWENGERPIAKVTVREGDRVYTNVAVHLKGAAGSFRSIDSKPALTLKFDKFVPDQSFHGLHKISLNNSVQDSSFLCEKIAREMFIAAGVPVPRAAHALVQINGKDEGLYVILEGANRQFLKKYFDNPDGNLYDGGFCHEVSPRLFVNCGENPNDNSGLKNLCSAVSAWRPDYARLEKVLDTDRFISMMALEMFLCHWDGYTLNKNNWRIFHDLQSNRMVFIPHGLDQLFGAGRQFDPGSPITPQHVSGKVASALLATPEGQRKYRERVSQLYTNVFKMSDLVSRVDELSAGISASLAETHPQLARSFQQRANSLKQRIIRRCEGLRRQLGEPVAPLEFGSDGVLQLTGWKPSLVQSGDPVLSQTNDPSGHSVLSIAAGESPSSSSWRTRIVVPSGSYQFVGRIRVKGVSIAEGDQRAGAGLRISKGTMPRKMIGTTDWKDYKYSFDVTETSADVELICELKATAGEASFDVNSLKLVRLK